MTKTIRVWAIYYKIRCSSSESWRKYDWIGPCGVHITGRTAINPYLCDCLSGRPFFFRTRALARRRAKELIKHKNITWFWYKRTVRPFILTWTEGD